jgi:hypothetical protein
MKKYNILFSALIALAIFLISCQEEHELGSELQVADIDFSVTQQEGYQNKVFLTNQTPGVIPYWDYSLGVSRQNVDTVLYPFAGNYWIKLTLFSAPEWKYLTNGQKGKTWVFDGVAPIGFYGSEYLEHTGNSANDWSYFPEDCPSWSGFGCGTNWGEMTFDLNGGYNFTVKQRSLTEDKYTTTTGKFGYDIDSKALSFIGVPMLYSGNYDSVLSWTQSYVFDISETVLYLAVIRNDGARLRFKYVPKS